MHAIVAVGMIVDVPVRKIEGCLQPVSDTVFKLMPKIEVVRVRLSLSAAVELPRDPVFELKFPILRGCNLIRVGEVTLGGGSRNARGLCKQVIPWQREGAEDAQRLPAGEPGGGRGRGGHGNGRHDVELNGESATWKDRSSGAEFGKNVPDVTALEECE